MKKVLVFGVAFWVLGFAFARASAVPAEAKKHLAYGAAALEMAQDDGGFKKAAAEFEQAAKLAPKWPAPYYNLGVVYSKLEDWEDALVNYQQYLKLSPKAKDREAVQDQIYKLQFKQEQGTDMSPFSGFYDSNGDENPMFTFAFQDRGKMHGGSQITYQRTNEEYMLWNDDYELKFDKTTRTIYFDTQFNFCTDGKREPGHTVRVFGHLVPLDKTPGETWAVVTFPYHGQNWVYQFKMSQKN